MPAVNCLARLLAIIVLTLPLSACRSQTGIEGVPVTGSVTLDGAPLEQGSITFIPAAGDHPTVGASISGGQFQATVPEGTCRVAISASKSVGKRKTSNAPGSREIDIMQEMLPERYNARTTLTADVKRGQPPQKFDLVSDPPGP